MVINPDCDSEDR